MLYLFDFLFEGNPSSKDTLNKENYYNQFLEAAQLQFYRRLYNDNANLSYLNINREIHPFHLLFGCNANDVFKKLGYAKHKTSTVTNGTRFDVLFFKKEFFQYWSIIQIHLVNNQLVFGKITIPHHSRNIKPAFSKLLSVKYSEKINLDTIDTIVVCDADNNRMMYKNFFYPSLLFVGNIIHRFKHDEELQHNTASLQV